MAGWHWTQRDRNCFDCKQRAPVRLPNFSGIVAERDASRQREADARAKSEEAVAQELALRATLRRQLSHPESKCSSKKTQKQRALLVRLCLDQAAFFACWAFTRAHLALAAAAILFRLRAIAFASDVPPFLKGRDGGSTLGRLVRKPRRNISGIMINLLHDRPGLFAGQRNLHRICS
jgi:hypothetical protein